MTNNTADAKDHSKTLMNILSFRNRISSSYDCLRKSVASLMEYVFNSFIAADVLNLFENYMAIGENQSPAIAAIETLIHIIQNHDGKKCLFIHTSDDHTIFECISACIKAGIGIRAVVLIYKVFFGQAQLSISWFKRLRRQFVWWKV